MIKINAQGMTPGLRAVCIAGFASLSLAACGSVGGGTSLKNSASLAPTKKAVASSVAVASVRKTYPSGGNSAKIADSAGNRAAAGVRKTASAAQTGRDDANPVYRKLRTAGAKKIKAAAKASKNAGAMSSGRKKVSAAKLAKVKIVRKTVRKAPEKPAVKTARVQKGKTRQLARSKAKTPVMAAPEKATDAVSEPASSAAVVAVREAPVPVVQMVPAKAIPVQIVPEKSPEELIADLKRQTRPEMPEAGRVAKADIAAPVTRFGQIEHRFSGQ